MRHGILDPSLNRWLLKKRDSWICRFSLSVPFYVNLLPDISGLSVSTSHWWTIICCSLTTFRSCVSVAARAAHLALSFVLHLLSLCSAVSATWHALTRLFLCFFSPQLSFPEHDRSISTTPVEVSFSHIENMSVRLQKMTHAFFFKTWLHYHKYEYIYCTAYEYIQTYRHHSHSTH